MKVCARQCYKNRFMLAANGLTPHEHGVGRRDKINYESTAQNSQLSTGFLGDVFIQIEIDC